LAEEIPAHSGFGRIADYAVLGTNSIWLQKGSAILYGDVGVTEATEGPWLNADVSASIGKQVHLEDGIRILANTVEVKTGASVDDVYANAVINKGTIRGTEFSTFPFPLDVSLPEMPAPTPGEDSLKVKKGDTVVLDPGQYGPVTVRSKATLILTGGTYHIENLDLGHKANVLFRGPSDVVINGRLRPGTQAEIGPDTNSGIEARDVRIFVHGINGDDGALASKPKAAVIGKNNLLRASLYVPNGTLRIRAGTSATGAFIGKDVRIGRDVSVTLDPGFGSPPEADDDGDGDANGCGESQLDNDGDGYAEVGGDCDDADPAVHPSAVELCNGVDDNCSGAVDEGVA
jgi:hypothetical protein